MLILCLSVCVSEIISRPLIGRKLATSPDVVRRSQTTSDGTNRTLAKFYPIFWCGRLLYDKNWRFQGFFDVELFDEDQLGGTAPAFCTTKIDDFRASSTLSSLTTWLRRPLRKDQLFGDLCTTKIGDLKRTCPCRSHIQRLHYPAFAAFFISQTDQRSM